MFPVASDTPDNPQGTCSFPRDLDALSTSIWLSPCHLALSLCVFTSAINLNEAESTLWMQRMKSCGFYRTFSIKGKECLPTMLPWFDKGISSSMPFRNSELAVKTWLAADRRIYGHDYIAGWGCRAQGPRFFLFCLNLVLDNWCVYLELIHETVHFWNVFSYICTW